MTRPEIRYWRRQRIQEVCVIVGGILGIVSGLALAAWLGGYVMLYQGVTEAIMCPNAGSIIKAIFFGVGTMPGFFLVIVVANWLVEEGW